MENQGWKDDGRYEKLFLAKLAGTMGCTASVVSHRDLISTFARQSVDEAQIPPRSDQFRYGVAMLRGTRNLPEFESHFQGENPGEEYLEEAVTHYIKPAAEKMHSEAENLYAICLHFGIGVDLTDQRRSICEQIFFSRAVLHGSFCGRYNYARFLIETNRDLMKGIRLLEGLTTVHCHNSPLDELVQRQFLRGTPLSNDQYEYVSKASERWDLGAMIMLGRHLFSKGKDKDAMFYFKLAAIRGHPTGCFLYACMLLNSEKRETEAHYYYDKAAKKERRYAFLYAKLLFCDPKTTRMTPEGAEEGSQGEVEIKETPIKDIKEAITRLEKARTRLEKARTKPEEVKKLTKEDTRKAIEEIRKEARKAREAVEEAMEHVKAMEGSRNNEPIDKRIKQAKRDIERVKEQLERAKRDIREIATEDMRQKVARAIRNCKKEANKDDKVPAMGVCKQDEIREAMARLVEMVEKDMRERGVTDGKKIEEISKQAREIQQPIAKKFDEEITELMSKVEEINRESMRGRAEEMMNQAREILRKVTEKLEVKIKELMPKVEEITRKSMGERAEEISKQAREIQQPIAKKFEADITELMSRAREIARESVRERAEEMMNQAREILRKVTEKLEAKLKELMWRVEEIAMESIRERAQEMINQAREIQQEIPQKFEAEITELMSRVDEIARESMGERAEEMKKQARESQQKVTEELEAKITELMSRVEEIARESMGQRADKLMKQAIEILRKVTEKFDADITELMWRIDEITRESMGQRADVLMKQAIEILRKVTEKQIPETFGAEVRTVIEALGEVAVTDMTEEAKDMRTAEEGLRDCEESLRKAEEWTKEAETGLWRGEQDLRKAGAWTKKAETDLRKGEEALRSRRDRIAMIAVPYYRIAAEGVLIVRKSTEMNRFYFDLPS